MSKYKLAISIITYERPKDIDLMLANIADFTKKLSIGIYIFDGSIKNDTEDVVKKYLDNGFGNIEYKKYENPALPLRTYDMFNVPDCEYIWAIRDRMFFKDINVYKYLISLLKLNPTIVSLFHYDYSTPLKFFYSKNEYVKKFIYSFQLLGSFIIEKKAVRYVNASIYKKQYSISWIQVAVALNSVVNSEKFLGIQTSFDKSLLYLNTNSHSWDKTDDYITAMFEDKLYCVEDFVKENNEYNVKELALAFGMPNTYTELLFLRESNRLNLKTFRRFDECFKKYSKLKKRIVFLIAILPRFLATCLRAFFKGIEFFLNILKSLYCKIKYFVEYKLKHS